MLPAATPHDSTCLKLSKFLVAQNDELQDHRKRIDKLLGRWEAYHKAKENGAQDQTSCGTESSEVENDEESDDQTDQEDGKDPVNSSVDTDTDTDETDEEDQSNFSAAKFVSTLKDRLGGDDEQVKNLLTHDLSELVHETKLHGDNFPDRQMFI